MRGRVGLRVGNNRHKSAAYYSISDTSVVPTTYDHHRGGRQTAVFKGHYGQGRILPGSMGISAGGELQRPENWRTNER